MPSATARIVLIHGAATTARVWDRVIDHLGSCDVVALERPLTGSWRRELEWLAPRVEGSFVVGMSGGATLGLGLAMGETPLVGALLHEPAVGRLLPELLTPMAEAFTAGGTLGFARMLYGSSWTADMSGAVPESVVAAEVAMFRAFEPGPPGAQSGAVLVTTGSTSPVVRQQAASALHDAYGYRAATLAGAGHFIAHDQPEVLATTIRAELHRLRTGQDPRSARTPDLPVGQ